MVRFLWMAQSRVFLVPPKERRHLYVAAPTSWKDYKPCRALSEPLSPVAAYKANAMVGLGEEGKVGVKRDVFLRIAIADHCVMVSMQFLERVWS